MLLSSTISPTLAPAWRRRYMAGQSVLLQLPPAGPQHPTHSPSALSCAPCAAARRQERSAAARAGLEVQRAHRGFTAGLEHAAHRRDTKYWEITWEIIGKVARCQMSGDQVSRCQVSRCQVSRCQATRCQVTR